MIPSEIQGGNKLRKIWILVISSMFFPLSPTQCGAAAKTSRLIARLSENKGEQKNDKAKVPLILARPHFGSKRERELIFSEARHLLSLSDALAS